MHDRSSFESSRPVAGAIRHPAAGASRRAAEGRVRHAATGAITFAAGAFLLAATLAPPAALRAQTGAAPAVTAARAQTASASAVIAAHPAPGAALPAAAARGVHEPELAQQVVVRRTAYGVPHIRAENLRAAFFAMGYIQVEDYGDRVVRGLIRSRGDMGRVYGIDEVGSDFGNRLEYGRAAETYHLLDPDTRDVLEGFAAGVNRYIELHPDEFDDRVRPDFSGVNVHARSIGGVSLGKARRFVERLRERHEAEDTAEVALGSRSARPANGWEALVASDLALEEPHPEAGSNAWAIAPSRTTSGNAILVRNPHLSWGAGYYEAQVTVPGELNFYGDFRIGGPFGIIGGFNERLGWATTNNGPDNDEFYALDVDPERVDHYLFEGASVPITREEVTVEFRNGESFGRQTREFWRTPLGPVIHRAYGKIYVMRGAGDRDYRVGQQFLRMMRADDLEEWKAAMRMRARTASNFTYADADGNIFYVWNGAVPDMPHPSGGDTAAVPAAGVRDIWLEPISWDSLPQLANPEGGYLHNENDPFHFANLNEIMDPADYPEFFPEPRLRLRSQHSVELVHNDRTFSLEDIIRMKNSMRMLLADRVKDDLVAAVRATNRTGEVAEAIELIEEWDNTVARDSRGGVLFREWWWRYLETGDTTVEDSPASAGFDAAPESLFAEPWRFDAPMTTPRGLADPERAAQAFEWAVEEAAEEYGAWDVAWGDVHRARIGDLEVPVGGCTGTLGCFRVLWFVEDDEEPGKRFVRGGDGWVLAVEFGESPRAYSILAYGQSDREDSPHYDDQLRLFANNEWKRVAFTESDIRDGTIREYRPGGEATAAQDR